MTRSHIVVWGFVPAVLVVAIGVAATARRSNLSRSEDDVPFAMVKRGELELKAYTSGELQANHSITLSAPPIGGGSLQITKLLHTGTPVRKGDVVVEFDPSEQVYKLEQSRSELLQAEQEIAKAKADAAVLKAQDKVELLKARYADRSADIDGLMIEHVRATADVKIKAG